MSQKHIKDKVCKCRNCTMIDCLWGDPLLNRWEKRFIESMARYGWLDNYTYKQIAKLKQIWHKILRKRGLK